MGEKDRNMKWSKEDGTWNYLLLENVIISGFYQSMFIFKKGELLGPFSSSRCCKSEGHVKKVKCYRMCGDNGLA